MGAIVRIPILSVGAGTIAELPRWFEDLGVRRPMLISDLGIVRVGHFDRVMALIDDGYQTASFREVPANPTYAGVDAAADIYIDQASAMWSWLWEVALSSTQRNSSPYWAVTRGMRRTMSDFRNE
jgi:alcohol dehydrogenase class IV